MAYAFAVDNDVQVELTGTAVNIPTNNFAKMMYYLNSMSSCLDHMIPREFTNYGSFSSLTEADKLEILALTILLSPDILLNKVIFMVPSGDPVLNGHNNEFYKITNASTVLAAATNLIDTIVIGEKSVQVNSIMIFTDSWLHKYYISPIMEEKHRLEKKKTTPKPNYNSSHNNYARFDDDDDKRARTRTNWCAKCCCCIMLLLFLIAVASVLLPLFVIPHCRTTFLSEFKECWNCMIVRNYTCAG